MMETYTLALVLHGCPDSKKKFERTFWTLVDQVDIVYQLVPLQSKFQLTFLSSFTMFSSGSSKKEKEPIDTVAKLAELRAALTAEVNAMVTDEDCHRFLVARTYDIPKTLDMLNRWAVWWNSPLTDHQIENKDLRPRDLLTTRSDNKEHLSAGSFLWSNTGEDKEGRPMYWEKVGYRKTCFIT